MGFPATREAMEKAGYRRSNYSRCKGCSGAIEWWMTPTGSRIPMEPMPDPESMAKSHWGTCPNAKDFQKKKEPQPCRPEDSQAQLFSSAPPQPSVNNTENKGNTKS